MFSAAKRATEPATGTGNGKRRTLRKFTLRIEWETLAWSLGPIINGPVKLLLFTWKIEVLIVWHSHMIKLPVNETKWSILLTRTRALILFISIWIFDFGPKKVIGTFKKRAPGPHYCARPMRFGSRGPSVVQSVVLDTSPKCIDREGLGSQEWRGSGTMRVYKVKPFNRYMGNTMV